MTAPATLGNSLTLPRARLAELIAALSARGYQVIGPTLREGAIVYDAIESERDLPIGLRDVQAPGSYRVEARQDAAVFGFAVGPHSFKKLFHVPEERLYRVRREGKSLRFEPEPVAAKKLALFGARGCDLAALQIHDRVLLGDLHRDARYAARRSNVFVVAVHCAVASAACFCDSMGTGPRAAAPWDLALTELLGDGEHRFVLEVGSEAGGDVVRGLGLEPTRPDDRKAGQDVVERTRASLGRTLDVDGLPALLRANAEHPRWDAVAARCLACTNCTMVCPTCFCTTIEDTTDLAGETGERTRRWDSCFTSDFSYLHGGSVRASTSARYRQWLMHKLSTWVDQFGTSGCVGCGRCITWCPVGIDITEEAAAIRATSAPAKSE